MDAVFWVYIVFGILMLMGGRRFFWVFIGAMGFIAGFTYGQEIFGLESLTVLLIAASVLGVAGIVIALFMQGIAFGIAGFLAGSYVAFSLLPLVGTFSPEMTWFIVLGGGVAGVVLTMVLIDWMLIFLSSVTGAAIIVHFLSPETWVRPTIWIALSVAGIVIQTILFAGKKKEED